MPGRSYFSTTQYRYDFKGQEKTPDIFEGRTTTEFWEYDGRTSRRLNIDPHASSYAPLLPYSAFADNPINVIDPDGQNIIVIRNSDGARGTGHGAILVGNNKDGWTNISKDGFTGSAFDSKSKFVFYIFISKKEFRNSPHNFVLAEGTHSIKDGTVASSLNFKLDGDGNKIQRFDKALYFGTTQAEGSSTDAKTIDAATKTAKADYSLTKSDCSDVVTTG